MESPPPSSSISERRHRRLSNFHVVPSALTPTASATTFGSLSASASVFASSPTSTASKRTTLSRSRLSNFHRKNSLQPQHVTGTQNDSNIKSPTNAAASHHKRQSRRLTRTTENPTRLALHDITNRAASPKPIENLSREELSHMYSSTIKLCQDNKINVKNTWNLNLIDYMPMLFYDKNTSENREQQHMEEVMRRRRRQTMSKEEETDFQLAGQTLDAGVKIYCSRVDSVHTNAFKVLGGLSHQKATQNNDDDGDGDGGDNEENTDENSQRKNRKNVGTGRATLETNMKNITTQRLETDLTADPLFKKMSAAFDEGGAEGMLLHNLPISPSGYLVFDSAEPATILTDNLGKDDDGDEQGLFYDVTNLLPDVPSENEIICREFLRFYNARTGRGDGDDEEMSMSTNMSMGMSMGMSMSMSTNESIGGSTLSESIGAGAVRVDSQHISDAVNFEYEDHDMDDNDDMCGQFSPSSASDDPMNGMNVPEEEATVTGDNNDVNLFADPLQQNNPLTTLAFSKGTGHEMDLIEAGMELQGDNPYAFFSHSALSSWAGPQHWRFNRNFHSTSTPGEIDEEEGKNKKPKKKARGKKSMLLDFSEEAVPIDLENEFRQAKSEGSLQLASKNSNSEKHVTLPVDLHLDVEWMTELFIKNGVRLRDIGNSGGISSSDGGADGIVSGLQGTDVQEEGGDDEGNGNGWHDFDNDGDEEFGGISGWNKDDAGTGAGDDDGDDDDDDGYDGVVGLGEAPKRVEPVDIGYARVAKKVDVRTLKSGLWARLCGEKSLNCSSTPSKPFEDVSTASPEEEGGEVQGEQVKSKGILEGGEVAEERLQNVVRDMKQFVPTQSLPDVTLPYVFICLLHLANEKGLRIEAASCASTSQGGDVVASLDDVVISLE